MEWSDFSDIADSQVKFDSSGDGLARYTIYNYQKNSQSNGYDYKVTRTYVLLMQNFLAEWKWFIGWICIVGQSIRPRMPLLCTEMEGGGLSGPGRQTILTLLCPDDFLSLDTLTPHTSHLTPHTSHLTPHFVLPLTTVYVMRRSLNLTKSWTKFKNKVF